MTFNSYSPHDGDRTAHEQILDEGLLRGEDGAGQTREARAVAQVATPHCTARNASDREAKIPGIAIKKLE